MHDDAPLVVVVDDDEAICRSVTRLLDAEGYRVRAYTTARDYLDDRDEASPSCALVDIRMPDVDGLALIRALRGTGNDVPTVFMTATGHIPTVVEAMKEGALDLLAKPFTAEDLSAAIRRATESDRRTHDDRRALLERWRRLERLTPREAEVCALVACGLLNKRIAALIGTKEKTVKVHRGRVMKKLNVSSVAELVRFVESVLAEAERKLIKLDGVEIARPAIADILIEVTARGREHATTAPEPAPMDQRAILLRR
jgi:FixJ family two-component response regulator